MGVRTKRWPQTPRERVWSKVKIAKPEQCWEWQGRRNRTGYGTTKVGERHWLVHRLVWTWTRGELSEGQCVLHACDNPACVNPSHLWLGTRADNNADKLRKGRHRVAVGERQHCSKLTAAKVRWARESYSRGVTQTEIAKRLGVHQGSISKIVLRLTWKHIE